jgi:sarcosine oxidase
VPPSRWDVTGNERRDWLPGVDAAEFTPISCTYTTTPNSDFLIDRSGPLVVAAGFSGHGFKFVPALGHLLADLALTDRRPQARFALLR